LLQQIEAAILIPTGLLELLAGRQFLSQQLQLLLGEHGKTLLRVHHQLQHQRPGLTVGLHTDKHRLIQRQSVVIIVPGQQTVHAHQLGSIKIQQLTAAPGHQWLRTRPHLDDLIFFGSQHASQYRHELPLFKPGAGR